MAQALPDWVLVAKAVTKKSTGYLNVGAPVLSVLFEPRCRLPFLCFQSNVLLESVEFLKSGVSIDPSESGALEIPSGSLFLPRGTCRFL